MAVKSPGKALSICLAACLLLCAGALGYVRASIQSGLDEWCAKAQEAHPQPGDDVAALIEYVRSGTHGLGDRNRAVWALGQARDERAVEALRAFVTGEDCNHSEYLCQCELQKALKLSRRDSINILRIRPPARPSTRGGT